MEHDILPPSKFWSKSKWILNLLSCIVISAMTIFVCCIPFKRYHYLFTWHVVLGTVAYLLLFPPSLLIFSSSWCLGLSRKQKSWIHGIFSLVASILAIVCVILDYHRKEVYKPHYPEITHFESSHAITGLIAAILLVISNVSGLFTGIVTWFKKKLIRPVVIKLFHNIVGQGAFVIGIISLCLAFHTSWFLYYTNLATAWALTIFTILVTFWSLVNSVLSAKSQISILMDPN